MSIITVTDFTLANPPKELSSLELEVLVETFTNPTVKRYLDTLLWEQMRSLVSIPIKDISDEDYKLQHAYVKGCIGMLITLSSIEREQKPTAPAR